MVISILIAPFLPVIQTAHHGHDQNLFMDRDILIHKKIQ